MAAIKLKIQNNLISIIIIALLSGLFCPGLNRIPDNSVIVVMMAIVFLSCANINISDFAMVSLRETLLFYLLRFIALPFILFAVTKLWAPDFAHGVLLLALVPAGVSSAALAQLFGGSVSIALTVTIVSTLLAPIVIPLFFTVLSDTSVNIDTASMFGTLSLLVFVPLGLDRLLDAFAPKKRFAIRANSGWLSVIFVGVLVMLVISRYQNQFWREPSIAAYSLALLSIEYTLFYLFGWLCLNWISGNEPMTMKKVSYAICSGANNNGLAAALAVLYLSPTNGIYSVLSEIPWVLALIPVKMILGNWVARTA